MRLTKQEIGAILRSLREQKGFTQKEVAEHFGRKQQIVGHWETGYSQPDAGTLFELCDFYGADISTAFGFANSTSASAPLLNADEIFLLKNFRKLNAEGQEKALSNIEDLVDTGKYKKDNSCGMVQETA